MSFFQKTKVIISSCLGHKNGPNDHRTEGIQSVNTDINYVSAKNYEFHAITFVIQLKKKVVLGVAVHFQIIFSYNSFF